MNYLKNFLSYIHPITIKNYQGNVTPNLEVVRQNGKNVLNSENANYSFNGLHLIFESIFKKLKISKYEFNNILILGMGAGSIISILRDQYKIETPITAIEKDEVIIEIAQTFFGINRHENLTIINTDAFDYIKNTNEKYDLIISDIFIDNNVPHKFETNEYIAGLKNASMNSSIVMFNKMTEDESHKKELGSLKNIFNSIFGDYKEEKLLIHSSENTVLLSNTFTY